MRATLAIFFILSCLNMTAQEDVETIKVKKVQQLVKAEYDNTQFMLVAIDRFGNPKEKAVRSFELHYAIKKKLYRFISYDNKLSPEMLANLKELKKAQKIFFTKIKAEDDAGHLVELPDVIEVHFPDCKNCTPNKKPVEFTGWN
ncbi:MAG: hypothetical protein ACJ76F_00465 [Bacteroidia bacterium]